MHQVRAFFTMTLLPSVSVLAAGSVYGNTPASATAELYDPTAGTWRTTGAMAIARGLDTATLLGNGKVFVVGGIGPSGTATATTELYDPASAKWQRGPNLIQERAQHTASLLSNGQVLVAGGQVVPPQGAGLASAELFRAG